MLHKNGDEEIYSMEREYCRKGVHLIHEHGFIVLFLQYYTFGSKYGKSTQKRIKKLLPKYNCTYVNPNNVLCFATHDDAHRFFEDVYAPLIIAKKLK